MLFAASGRPLFVQYTDNIKLLLLLTAASTKLDIKCEQTFLQQFCKVLTLTFCKTLNFQK